MKENFEQCLAHVLKSEGGYVNNPKDPGGETNLGVTRRVWQSWVGRDLTDDEMHQLTPEMVAPLYRAKYWDAIQGDVLPSGLDLCVFDTAVNSGPGRAVKLLQGCIGVATDGAIGNNTLSAVAQFKNQALIDLINGYCDSRQAFLASLPTFSTFGKGWSRRVSEVREQAIIMAQ